MGLLLKGHISLQRSGLLSGSSSGLSKLLWISGSLRKTLIRTEYDSSLYCQGQRSPLLTELEVRALCPQSGEGRWSTGKRGERWRNSQGGGLGQDQGRMSERNIPTPPGAWPTAPATPDPCQSKLGTGIRGTSARGRQAQESCRVFSALVPAPASPAPIQPVSPMALPTCRMERKSGRWTDSPGMRGSCPVTTARAHPGQTEKPIPD